jgi:hypothetical protein
MRAVPRLRKMFLAISLLVASPSMLFAGVVISEFSAAGGLRDEDRETQDWIELHNSGPGAVNLDGWTLTDNREQKSKWKFPARTITPGEFLVIFASGKNRSFAEASKSLHTNFKLELKGEYLALFNADSPSKAVSEFSPEYPDQRHNHSYGVNPAGRWVYFKTPTPGAANGDSAIIGIAPVPEFSVERGMYDAPITLRLSAARPNATIRYTVDGSEPGPGNGAAYSAPLTITNTTIVRAVAMKDGYLAARIVTHTYLFLDQVLHQSNSPRGFPKAWGRSRGFENGVIPADYEMDMDPLRVNPNDPKSAVSPEKLQRFRAGLRELPMVSLAMSTAEMFGPGGLYVTGQEAQVKEPNEKRASIEMILPDGKSAFAATCSLDLHGNASRNPMKSPKHGFKIAFKENFGASSLKDRLFPDSPADNFDDLILRPDFGVSWLHWSDSAGNPHGDYQRTRAARIRDAWLKETRRDMGGMASYNRFCHLFINGLYWGVYDFTEQPTDSFAKNHFGGEKSDYDIYDQGTLRRGKPAAYNAMCAITGLERSAAYERIQQFLDIPQFIDYTLLHMFVGHQDWFHAKNWYAIRRNTGAPQGLFVYIPWDGENVLLEVDVDRVNYPDGPSGLHAKLVRNAEYRLAFADHVFKHMIAPGGALTPAENIVRWRNWAALLDKPIVAESMRWGDYRRDVHPAFDGRYVLYTRESHWLPEIERVANSYLMRRNGIVLRQLRRAGLYPLVEPPVFNQQGGQIAAGFKLKMEAPQGKIYYTTNGADPRRSGTGEIVPEAIAYEGAPIALGGTVHLKARVRNGDKWSALNELPSLSGTSRNRQFRASIYGADFARSRKHKRSLYAENNPFV